MEAHLPLFLPPQLQPGRLPPGPPLLTDPPPVWVVLLLLLTFGHKTKILIMSQINILDFNENISYVLKVPKSLKVHNLIEPFHIMLIVNTS